MIFGACETYVSDNRIRGKKNLDIEVKGGKRRQLMNITIEIHYISNSKILQKGSFPLRGRKPEQVALQFWKDIKREMSHELELEEVIAAGENITDLVKDLERKELLLFEGE